LVTAPANMTSANADNGQFADRAPTDAKRASRDGLGLALAIYAALIVIASLGGAFGTHRIELGPRFAFWTALIVWNAMKWHVWLSLLSKRGGWTLAIAIGALVLNLSLPFETRIALGMTPAQAWNEYLRIYLSAVAISLVSGVACTVAVRHFSPTRRGLVAAHGGPPQPSDHARGPLAFADAQTWAIEAEDHYVRVLLANGRSTLLPGGRWAADAAVAGVEREGRVWRVVLPDGRRLGVSASHVGSIRERGWMGRSPPGRR